MRRTVDMMIKGIETKTGTPSKKNYRKTSNGMQ